MNNPRPWFLRLLLAFLLLDSHRIATYDIKNKISTEQAFTSSLSISTSRNSYAYELYAEKTNTLSTKIINAPLTTVPAIHSMSVKPNIRRFVTSAVPKSRYKKVSRFRHRVSNSEGNGQRATNLVNFPKPVNTVRTANSSLEAAPEEVQFRKTKNKIYASKVTWKILSFARDLSAEMNKNFVNGTEEETISQLLQYVKDGKAVKYGNRFSRINSHQVQYIPLGSNPLVSRYAYFPNDLKVESPENSVDTFVDCFATHEFCHQPSRKNPRRRTCSCDEECEDYGNCCIDYNFRSTKVETEDKVRYSCVKARRHFGYFAVSSCPSVWRNAYVRGLCENEKNDKSDVLLQVPVSSKDTYLTYSNVYCAFCNGDTNGEFWSVKTPCPNSCPHSVDGTGLIKCSNASISFSEPQFLLPNKTERRANTGSSRYLVKCRNDLVSKCPQHWMSETRNQTAMEVAMKCTLVYAPVSLLGFLSPEVPKYKNEFCAICNGVTAIHLLCPIKMGSSNPKSPTTSMSVLLDMDFTKGGMIVGKQERCPRMHLYDPWKEVCRSVACKQHFDYKSGHCVPQMAYSGQLMEHQQENQQLFNDSSFSGCLQVILALEEVSITENGTLMISSDGSVYQPGEYENTNNKTVAVCVPANMYSLYVSTFTDFQGHLTIAGMSISLIFLLIRILLSVLFPERHKLPPKIVLFLSITLFFSQMLFIFGIYQIGNHVVCVVTGMFMHYGFLSSFFWTNVLAYDIWKTFGSSQIKTKTHFAKKQLLCYCMYGWVSPLFIVALTVSFDWIAPYEPLKPHYGRSVCWISNKAALAAFFGLPLAILLVLNTIFFFITSMQIRKTTKATKFAHDTCLGAKNRVRFGLYCKLAFIMGLTWVFGFVAAFSGNSVLWYFFVAFNSTQGVYIFVAFTHFRIPSNFIPKKSSQWTLSGNSTTSRSSATVSAKKAKL